MTSADIRRGVDAVANQPNFFFIGGMRCGSTTLNLVLEQHPDIFMSPVKEPCFYLAEAVRRANSMGEVSDEATKAQEAKGHFRQRESYLSLFANAENQRYLGESSHYLYHPRAAQLIHADCENAQILVCLRNPIDRLFSEYLLDVRLGRIAFDFATFVSSNCAGHQTDSAEGRLAVSKLNKGLQHAHLTPWLERFGSQSVKWVLFDDLEADPAGVARSIFSWLGVNPAFEPAIVHTERGGVPRQKWLISALNTDLPVFRSLKRSIPKLAKQRARSWVYSKTFNRPSIDVETRAFLEDFYAEDIGNLEKTIGRDLSAWRDGSMAIGDTPGGLASRSV